MNAEELRSVQAPLKERYRENPEAAFITLRAARASRRRCQLQDLNGQGARRGGAAPGDRRRRGSASARATCCSRRSLRVRESHWVRSLPRWRSRRREAASSVPRVTSTSAERSQSARKRRRGSRRSGWSFELESDATDADLDTLLRLTERYCVVYQTLAQPARLDGYPQNRRA